MGQGWVEGSEGGGDGCGCVGVGVDLLEGGACHSRRGHRGPSAELRAPAYLSMFHHEPARGGASLLEAEISPGAYLSETKHPTGPVHQRRIILLGPSRR